MKLKPVTQYALYYSYTRAPFEEEDMYWHRYSTYPGIEEVTDAMVDGYTWGEDEEVYYIVVEEVKHRKVAYAEAGV